MMKKDPPGPHNADPSHVNHPVNLSGGGGNQEASADMMDETNQGVSSSVAPQRDNGGDNIGGSRKANDCTRQPNQTGTPQVSSGPVYKRQMLSDSGPAGGAAEPQESTVLKNDAPAAEEFLPTFKDQTRDVASPAAEDPVQRKARALAKYRPGAVLEPDSGSRPDETHNAPQNDYLVSARVVESTLRPEEVAQATPLLQINRRLLIMAFLLLACTIITAAAVVIAVVLTVLDGDSSNNNQTATMVSAPTPSAAPNLIFSAMPTSSAAPAPAGNATASNPPTSAMPSINPSAVPTSTNPSVIPSAMPSTSPGSMPTASPSTTPTTDLTTQPPIGPQCDGVGTEVELRSAIEGASGNPFDPTQIDLCPEKMIVLTNEIGITSKAFRLSCPVGSYCAVSGGNTNRMFGGSPRLAVFERISLLNGSASVFNNDEDGFGGALYLSGGRASLTDCLLQFNEAEFRGGAVYVAYGASLSVELSYFVNNRQNTGNSAPGGGAIQVQGQATISRSTFLENAANSFGGALYIVGGQTSNINADVTFIHSAFGLNLAGFGGALGVFNSQVSLSNTTFYSNRLKASRETWGRDIWISDSFASPFVDCDPDIPVVFCDGIDSRTIRQGEGPNAISTNCRENGIDGLSGQATCPT